MKLKLITDVTYSIIINNYPRMSTHTLHLSTLRNNDSNLWFIVRACGYVFYFPHDQEAIDHFSEHDVFTVQEVALGACDEELAAVGVASAVGHGEKTRSIVLQFEVFIVKTWSIYACGSGAIASDKVSSLNHEILDDSVERSSFESNWNTIFSHLASAQLSEVFTCFWTHVRVQLHDETPNLRLTHSYVKKHNRVFRMFKLLLNLIPGRHLGLLSNKKRSAASSP